MWDQGHIYAAYAVFCFLLAAILLPIPFPFLPQDQGRPYAVNGEQSKGKIRGSGLIMLACFLVCSFVFIPFRLEFLLYAVILFLEMLSGFLDDASKTPWSDYKKGLIDLVLSVSVGIVFILHNDTTVFIGPRSFTFPSVLYGVLATILVWMSVNAFNCTDGVDGLSSSVGLVSLISFLLIYPMEIESSYHGYTLLFAAVVAAYLLYNSSPSSILMGDAGSRPFGVLLAILAMKSHHPFSFLLICAVFIADGLPGLAKVFLLRFFKISIFRNIRTPLHDEVRKNRGWSDTQVVFRFVLVQILLSFLCYLISS